ncbi:MAG: ATP-binding cassette domain-containing protein [Bacilli bacterium]|jgi:ABC-type Mn2+/Zn2+ transport system ATPase subunit|nr:ATP-binding cassette domain-containing protein [Bacilli bacterium]
MIEFDDVSFSYRDEAILQRVSFRLEDGEYAGIIGLNGTGKTTLLKLILGLARPTAGNIKRDLGTVSYVSQTTSLSDASFPCSVYEAVSLGLVGAKPALFDLRKRKEKTLAALKEAHLYDLRNRLVSELSGGQLQKVKIAKALIGGPTTLVLDEPDAGMDEASHGRLIETIADLHEKRHISIVFVSHHYEDLKDAEAIYEVKDRGLIRLEKEDKRVRL